MEWIIKERWSPDAQGSHRSQWMTCWGTVEGVEHQDGNTNT